MFHPVNRTHWAFDAHFHREDDWTHGTWGLLSPASRAKLFVCCSGCMGASARTAISLLHLDGRWCRGREKKLGLQQCLLSPVKNRLWMGFKHQNCFVFWKNRVWDLDLSEIWWGWKLGFQSMKYNRDNQNPSGKAVLNQPWFHEDLHTTNNQQ